MRFANGMDVGCGTENGDAIGISGVRRLENAEAIADLLLDAMFGSLRREKRCEYILARTAPRFNVQMRLVHYYGLYSNASR